MPQSIAIGLPPIFGRNVPVDPDRTEWPPAADAFFSSSSRRWRFRASRSEVLVPDDFILVVIR